MGDRVQLETAEARVFLGNYVATAKKKGAAVAASCLTKQIKKVQELYGAGFEQRVRGYMRVLLDDELCGGDKK
jgi:hypothetical protein